MKKVTSQDIYYFIAHEDILEPYGEVCNFYANKCDFDLCSLCTGRGAYNAF